MVGVVTSLIRCNVGESLQLSIAAGSRASANAIAVVSLHSRISSSEPGVV